MINPPVLLYYGMNGTEWWMNMNAAVVFVCVLPGSRNQSLFCFFRLCCDMFLNATFSARGGVCVRSCLWIMHWPLIAC